MLLGQKTGIVKLFENINRTMDKIQNIKKDIGLCELPILITKRKKELEEFQEKLQGVIEKDLNEFKELQFKSTRDEIKDPIIKIRKEIENKLNSINDEASNLINLDLKELQSYEDS